MQFGATVIDRPIPTRTILFAGVKITLTAPGTAFYRLLGQRLPPPEPTFLKWDDHASAPVPVTNEKTPEFEALSVQWYLRHLILKRYMLLRQAVPPMRMGEAWEGEHPEPEIAGEWGSFCDLLAVTWADVVHIPRASFLLLDEALAALEAGAGDIEGKKIVTATAVVSETASSPTIPKTESSSVPEALSESLPDTGLPS